MEKAGTLFAHLMLIKRSLAADSHTDSVATSYRYIGVPFTSWGYWEGKRENVRKPLHCTERQTAFLIKTGGDEKEPGCLFKYSCHRWVKNHHLYLQFGEGCALGRHMSTLEGSLPSKRVPDFSFPCIQFSLGSAKCQAWLPI